MPDSIHGDWLKVRVVFTVNYLSNHNAVNLVYAIINVPVYCYSTVENEAHCETAKLREMLIRCVVCCT